VFGQVRWSGNCDPDPSGPVNLLKEVAREDLCRSQVQEEFRRLHSPELFEIPFLYITGHEELT